MCDHFLLITLPIVCFSAVLFVSNSALISRENCENYEGSSVHMTVESERWGVHIYIYIYI